MKTNWRDEFDWEFMQDDNHPWMETDITGTEVKKWIESLLSKQRDSLVEEHTVLTQTMELNYVKAIKKVGGMRLLTKVLTLIKGE